MCWLKPKTATLTGTVTDSKTGLPVAGAAVLVNGTKMATSDNRGHYTIKGLKPGQVTIEFDKIGYQTLIRLDSY
jgi:protocatechuate 3,4-dioxygenase beta subunit